MGSPAFRALAWRLLGVGRSLSWTAIMALGLLVLAAGFYFFAVLPVVDDRNKLISQVPTQRRSGPPISHPAPVTSDPRDDLATFYAALDPPSNAPDLLRRLHLMARNQGLLLRQAEYHPLPHPDGKLLRYQILLPAKGTYPDIRRFLAQASGELPGLAIDGVNFQRQKIEDAVLEVQIKFTLFLSTPS